MGVIDTVDDKTIEANVEKIGTNFTVGAGQTVEMIGGTVVVSSGATVTVEAEGSLTGITKVEGMVVVKDGGDCSIPRGGYAVRSVSADNTITYAGLKVAISNAQPGDVIEIGTGSTSESLTIPQGVTVTVKESLTIGGDLTVAQGAKLDVRGTLTFEKTNAKVTVNGELDVSKGAINGETYNLTSTGTSTFQSGSAPTAYNGAKYTYNGNDVITSVTNAVAFAAENDIPSVDVNGIFTETSDIAIDGVNVNILADAEITLGNVSIKDATINNDGELTAVITGYTGDGTATAVVELSGSAADVSCTSLIDAAGATTYTTYIDSYSGTMEIVSGTVVLDAENEVAVSADASSADMFTVAAGATLKTDVNATFSGKNVRINGTLDIQSTVSFTDMTIAGTVAVNKNGVLNIEGGVVVTGSITVSDVENEEGTLNINETVRVGETPKTLGATTGSIVGGATLASNMYIYVYPGASIAEAVINADSAGNSTAKSTAFYVNDVLYATVYAISGTVSGSGINTEIGNLEDVKTSADEIEWTADGQEVENGVAIGRYAELRAEVEYESVTIVVSAGPGLEIYIDDVKDKSSLTVGEHTVVVYVKSGYEGSPSITFNGQAVTDGKIVITADMIGQNVVLAATGATPIDYSQSGSSDGGFGLVEILLIILVILIVVMAIMVALRLMRS